MGSRAVWLDGNEALDIDMETTTEDLASIGDVGDAGIVEEDDVDHASDVDSSEGDDDGGCVEESEGQ